MKKVPSQTDTVQKGEIPEASYSSANVKETRLPKGGMPRKK